VWNNKSNGGMEDYDHITAQIDLSRNTLLFNRHYSVEINDPKYAQKVEDILKKIMSDTSNYHYYDNP
jgi:hypothetical protein